MASNANTLQHQALKPSHALQEAGLKQGAALLRANGQALGTLQDAHLVLREVFAAWIANAHHAD